MNIDELGLYRVIDPPECLPQAARRLDASPPCRDSELEISVEWLHVDAASFLQIRNAECDDVKRVATHICKLVASYGKLHNPVTGSGGMLIGTVSDVGRRFPRRPKVGRRIATLTSLTLTPLRIEHVDEVDLTHARLRVKGRAYLSPSNPWTTLPRNVPERAALAAMDVAGAAPRTRMRTKAGDKVLIFGAGGRSGLLASIAAKEAGAKAIIGVDNSSAALNRARELGAATKLIECDVRDAVEVAKLVHDRINLTVSCVDCSGAESAAILCTRRDGLIVFFSMATSFQAAALTAEGLGSPVSLEIGNGYVDGHARETFEILSRYPKLIQWFEGN